MRRLIVEKKGVPGIYAEVRQTGRGFWHVLVYDKTAPDAFASRAQWNVSRYVDKPRPPRKTPVVHYMGLPIQTSGLDYNRLGFSVSGPVKDIGIVAIEQYQDAVKYGRRSSL